MAVNVIDLHGIVKIYKPIRRAASIFGLSKSRKNLEPLRAIDRVDLSIQEGEIFGLLGSNGAGKTTLIKIMAGLLEPDGGTGNVLGYDIYRDHKIIRSKVSLVAPTADVGTDNNLTVRQNLEFWAVVYNLEKSRRKSRIDEMLEFLDLKQYEHFWPMSISAGNRQKLAIARSLLVRNPILFLDEPTVKLDAKGAEAVRELIRKINLEFGATIILTTHYIFEAEELCGRTAIMHRGVIRSCDTVENLRRNLKRYDELLLYGCGFDAAVLSEINSLPFVINADFRNNSGTEKTLVVQTENLKKNLNTVLKLLLDRNVQINGIDTGEPTLEDIFIDTIGHETGAQNAGGSL